MPHDVFVSYAHANDVRPNDTEFGWVTTFTGELSKLLRMKLGGQGADIWMDHQLTSNDRVTETLMQKIHDSRTIVLFMSRGYVESRWCKDEINSFLEQHSTHKNKESVFVVALDETNREAWPTRVQELTPIEFFKRSITGAIELLGYPNPPAESGSAYWTKLNELAHFIVKYLDQLGTVSRTVPQTRNVTSSASSSPRILPIVWIAQPTDDLHTEWEFLASAIRQRGADIRPLGHSTSPRSDISAFRSTVEADMAESTLLVQLLSATPGYPVVQGPGNTNSIQSALAKLHIETNSGITFLKWRSHEIDLEHITDTNHRELLQGAIACGFDQFRQQVLGVLDRLMSPKAVQDLSPPVDGPASLSFCITSGPKDIQLSSDVANIVGNLGHVPFVVQPAPDPDQSTGDYRTLFEDLLSDTHGVILVYGDESALWLQSRHAQVRKVLAQTRRGIWCAWLDGPPPTKPPLRCPDPAVVMLDCRQGVRPGPIQLFIASLSASITASATPVPIVNSPDRGVSRYDFFIAYATPDRQQAQNLCWFLQDHSREVFLDVQALSPGASWQPALREALEASRAIVVLVSTHADDAFYQQEEIGRAIQLTRDKPRAHTVIPIILENLPQGTRSMPYGMSSLQAQDATRPGGLRRVAAELVAWLDAH